jgi:hypothetical protein
MTKHLPLHAPDLDHSKLREILDYDQNTGIFSWKISVSRNIKVGQQAGSKKEGYRIIRVMGHRLYEHRLAWFYVYRTWPTKDLDHINASFDDNRIENLRETSESQNMANARLNKNNRSGFRGVFFNPRKGSWTARITQNRRKLYIGSYKTASEASDAYNRTARYLFGEFARVA